MVYGFGSHWEHTNEVQMERTENGYTTEVNLLNYALFNFCFKNGNNEWDNNYGGNYVFEVTEKVVESAFILNENVISEILENLFEINISEIEEKNAISAPIVEATIEPVSAEPVSEEFEVTYENNNKKNVGTYTVVATIAGTDDATLVTATPAAPRAIPSEPTIRSGLRPSFSTVKIATRVNEMFTTPISTVCIIGLPIPSDSKIRGAK